MKLRYAAPAARELADIIDYLAARSPQGARRVKARIDETIAILLEHPKSGPIVDRRGTRRIVVTPFRYLIFYLEEPGVVTILAIRHGARSPRSMPGGGRR